MWREIAPRDTGLFNSEVTSEVLEVRVNDKPYDNPEDRLSVSCRHY
jgi:hypothetical protein